MADKKLTIEDFLGFRLQQTAWNARGQFQKVIRHMELEITLEQAQVLLSLYKNEGISQIRLAEKVFRGRTNITRIINGLAERKLIMRQRDKIDKRCFRIYLTGTGRQILDRLIPVLTRANQRLIEGVGKQEYRQLMDALNKVDETITIFATTYLNPLE